MLLSAGGATGIFCNDQIKTQLPGVTRGGFDADIGGDTAQDDGVDTTTAQLQFQVSTVECSPLALGDLQVCRTLSQRLRVFPPVVG